MESSGNWRNNRKLRSVFISILIIAVFVSDSVNATCVEARRVAQRFLDLEQQGKRIYYNQEYINIRNYKDEDGNDGSEPGWDSANLVDSIPVILKCREVPNDEVVIDVSYRKTGEFDGSIIHMYNKTIVTHELLNLEKRDGIYKVNGLRIYKPFVTIAVLRKIIGKDKFIPVSR